MRTNVILLLLLIATAGCTTSPQVSSLPIREFRQVLESTPDNILLDVRTDTEVAGGTIAGATHLDFLGAGFTEQLGQFDKTKPVFVYCAVGSRSSGAARVLAQQGFQKIYNAEGGINAWLAAGYPLDRP
jgi:phage shock protein E